MVIKSEDVEILMGHGSSKRGLKANYYRPKENYLLEQYLKVSDQLTISEEHKLKTKVKELTQKNNEKEYIIKGKLQEKDEEIKSLKQKYESDMRTFEERMENKLQQILLKINFEKLGFGK